MTELLHYAVSELHLNLYDALYVVPLAHIILLRTETFFQNGGKGMTLFEVEDII